MKNSVVKTILIYVFAFDPIKIWTLYASQNDPWNLSFVKDINVVGNKMTRNGHKMTRNGHKMTRNGHKMTISKS